MKNIRKVFDGSVMVLLAATAICKLVSVSGEGRVLSVADPVFRFVTLRQLLLVVSVVELGVAWYLWKGRNPMTKSFLVLWLSALFIAYRLGLWLMHYKGCSCLGTVTYWLPVSPEVIDGLMKGLLAYFGVGSAVCFYRDIQESRCREGAGEMSTA